MIILIDKSKSCLMLQEFSMNEAERYRYWSFNGSRFLQVDPIKNRGSLDNNRKLHHGLI